VEGDELDDDDGRRKKRTMEGNEKYRWMRVPGV